MLKNILLAVALALGAVAVVLSVIALGGTGSSSSFGATVENFPSWFYNGLYAGTAKNFSVSAGGVVTSAGVTNTGNSSVTGTLTVTGASTFNGTLSAAGSNVQVGDATNIASSTLIIGTRTAAAAINKGCLILGDSGGATSSPVYITATGATITATTTRPTNCKAIP